jgi:hypothetical protein
MSEPTQPDPPADRNEVQSGDAPTEPPDRRRWWHCAGLRIAGRIAGFILAVPAAVLLAWLLLSQPGDVAARAGWFLGLGTFLVVVALWQSVIIRRQAKDDAKEAHERLRRELAAAEQRSARELANARELHRIELEAQREQARIQRAHLREQEFKLALIRVSRAINDYTHELAILIELGHRVVTMPEKQQREDALLPIGKKLGSLTKDIQLEISGARMFSRNTALHDALDAVVATMVLGPHAEAMFRQAMINSATMPRPVVDAIFQAMSTMQTAIGNARQLAGELLDTGWD